MVRPRINGPGKKRKTYQRRAVEYAHKRDVLDYIDSGHSLDETISQFYGDLSGSDIRAKKKQIHKWSKQAPTIRAACDSGRGCHRNLRGLGEATVLTKEAERAIVVWVNSLRKDGAPVSRLMLQLQAKEAAADIGLDGKFAATSTWVKLFLRRHKLALRVRTRQGQTTPQDAQDAATTFRALVLQTIVEKKCVQVYNADQTGVNFEYLPKQTISQRGVKTVWVKCANKEKARATAMLLADWEGTKLAPFIVFKCQPSKIKEKREENHTLRHGFSPTMWTREINPLQERYNCQIYGNQCAWWNSDLSLRFLKYHFAERTNRDDHILLIWGDFSGHWTPEVEEYAASINVILLKVPPRYTYVCQPADILWNNPLKTRLRGLWINRLKDQLVAYRAKEKQRQEKRDKLQRDIIRVRKDLVQEEAESEVERLRKQHTEEPFKLEPPKREDITEWISKCWNELSEKTIVSGFAKVGILADTRRAEQDFDSYPGHIDSELVQELEKCNLTDGHVDSDDDIESEAGTGSDSGSEC